MKGLLLKDLYMSASYCRSFLLLVVVFLAVSFFGDDSLFFIVYPTLIASIIPVTLISYDERDSWTQCSGTLPYSRGQLVSVKYLIGLLFGCVSLVLSLIASVVRMQLRHSFSLEELCFLASALLVLGVLGPGLLLPFIFKFGAEKGRIVFFVMVGFLCVVSIVAAGLGVQTALPAMGYTWTLAVVAAVVAALYALSWMLSIRFYEKREL